MTRPKSFHPALYRASQFFAAIKTSLFARRGGSRGQLAAGEQGLITAILPSPAQQALFAKMSPSDRRHAIAVVRTLRQTGHNDPALLQAALLHDVGKSLGQPIIHRVLIVLLNAFWPNALQRLSRLDGGLLPDRVSRWRRPFVVHAQHPAIGAAWAEAAGCHPLAVRLIARHQERSAAAPVEREQVLLTRLQWADDMN